MTEFGRQPWIIYHLMRTDRASTPRDGTWVEFLLIFLMDIALTAGLAFLLLPKAAVRTRLSYDFRVRRPDTHSAGDCLNTPI